MKAVICTKYGPPEVLQIREVGKPAPRENDVLIKIHATAVTASDCIVRGFRVPLGMKIPMGLVLGFGKPRNPILGMVLAGEVESCGKGVKRFTPGDQVFALSVKMVGNLSGQFGAYAEYACFPQDGMIAFKPSKLTFEEAAAIPYGGWLSLHCLKKANIRVRENVLIYGASGAIGTSAVQLARHFGAKVTGVCSTANLDFVRSLGADWIIDYTKEDFTRGERRYDFIFDAVGKKKSRLLASKSKCARVLAPNGIYLSVDDGTPNLDPEEFVLLGQLAEAGALKPVIDRCFPLEAIVEAHRYVDRGHKKGNVVITVSE